MYVKSLEELDLHLAAHRAFLRQQYADHVFLLSGPQVPRQGGIILAHAHSRADLEVIMARDPFAAAGVANTISLNSSNNGVGGIRHLKAAG